MQQQYISCQPPTFQPQQYGQETYGSDLNYPQVSSSSVAIIPTADEAAADLHMPWNQSDLDLVYFGLDFFDADSGSSNEWSLGLEADNSHSRVY